jgi:hypothetical protein
MMAVKSGLLRMIIGFGLVMVAFGASFSEEGPLKKLDLTGYVGIEAGQLVKYRYQDGKDYDHQWLEDNLLRLGVNTSFHPRLNASMGFEARLFYNTFPFNLNIVGNPGQVVFGTNIDFHFDRALITLNCSPDLKDSLLKIYIGLFPYKYNNEVRNLGEYLFRSGCYPGYLVSDEEGFDRTAPQLSGIRISNQLFNCWRNDLFLTSELYLWPLQDFSLSYVTSYSSFNKVFDIGAGISLYHIFPVDKHLTQPTSDDNGNAANYYFADGDAARTDTLHYTYAGTKLMARATFDPKPFFGSDIFGKEDLKIYAEAAILGVRNYPADSITNFQSNYTGNFFGYDKLLQKMPMMVGINFPMFKGLDVFSLEVEYYGKKYPNRVPVPKVGAAMIRYPVSTSPEGTGGNYSDNDYSGGAAQWKWSFYAKKTIFNNFSITGQIARDHSRIQTTLPVNIDQEEALIKDSHWYWILKFAYGF